MVLPKPMRIQGHKSFNYLHKKGVRFYGSSMLLRVVNGQSNLLSSNVYETGPKSCRCAVSISCKVNKKAVIRNQLRRMLHRHLRQRLELREEHSNKWALITLKQHSSTKPMFSLLEECDQLLKEAGLYR